MATPSPTRGAFESGAAWASLGGFRGDLGVGFWADFRLVRWLDWVRRVSSGECA